MALWPTARRVVCFASATAIALVAWTFLSRHFSERRWIERLGPRPAGPSATREADFERAYGGSSLKIMQFYAREGALLEGQHTVICYGVLNAATVRIEPPIEALSPSLNRCIEAAPERDTRYTLTAEDAGGHTASASFQIDVRPDPAALPRITNFAVAKSRLEEGRHIFLMVFSQVNGETVDIDPPVFRTLHGAPLGQFYVAPNQTTTYTLTVTGRKGRKTQKSLTLQVPPA